MVHEEQLALAIAVPRKEGTDSDASASDGNDATTSTKLSAASPPASSRTERSNAFVRTSYTSDTERQAAFPDWLDWYNYHRPHPESALEALTTLSR